MNSPRDNVLTHGLPGLELRVFPQAVRPGCPTRQRPECTPEYGASDAQDQPDDDPLHRSPPCVRGVSTSPGICPAQSISAVDLQTGQAVLQLADGPVGDCCALEREVLELRQGLQGRDPGVGDLG